MQNFCWLRRTPKHHEVKDKQEEPRHNTIDEEDANDIRGYEEDLTEQRIEGIEALVEQLSKTVLELNNKVFNLINDFVSYNIHKIHLEVAPVTEYLIYLCSCTFNIISGTSGITMHIIIYR